MFIMIVQSDDEDAELTAYTLKRGGYQTVIMPDGASALRFAQQKQPDMVLLDVWLPDSSGYQVCGLLRKSNPTLPVIFTSSAGAISDIIAGLNAGGDDYLVSPVHPSVLIARVTALLRRTRQVQVALPDHNEQLTVGSLALDLKRERATLNGRELHCTNVEFALLAQLARHEGRPLSPTFLLETVWGTKKQYDGRLVKVRICTLRRKLREAGGSEDLVQTVQGAGYALSAGGRS